MYSTQDKKILKTCFYIDESQIPGHVEKHMGGDYFESLFKTRIINNIKICKNFELHMHTINSIENIFEYNYIFYITTLSQLPYINTNTIRNIIVKLQTPLNHIFIIIDECINMYLHENSLQLHTNMQAYNDFCKSFHDINPDIYDICKINSIASIAWMKIITDNSLINLTVGEINDLASQLLKTPSKIINLTDRKRELKSILKKSNFNDHLVKTGYTQTSNCISSLYKLTNQKKIVCANYLKTFNETELTIDVNELQNIAALLKEIYGISYLNSEMHDDLTNKIDKIFLEKITNLYNKYHNNIYINQKINFDTGVDAYKYNNLLCDISQLCVDYNLCDVMEFTKREIALVQKLIVDYNTKEIESTTNIDKILHILKMFSNRDKNISKNIFESIKNNNKIISENVHQCDKWTSLINKCIEIGIQKDAIIDLIENIIMIKISNFSSIEKCAKNDVTVLYPQCLQVFLLANINKNFIFKKIYIYLSYTMRYSGRNIGDWIKTLDISTYNNLLIIENKLLELCEEAYNDPCITIASSDLDIVETFN